MDQRNLPPSEHHLTLNLSSTSSLDFSNELLRLQQAPDKEWVVTLDFGLDAPQLLTNLYTPLFSESVYRAAEHAYDSIFSILEGVNISLRIDLGSAIFPLEKAKSQKHMYCFTNWLHEGFESNEVFAAYIDAPYSRDDVEAIIELPMGIHLFSVFALEQISAFLLHVVALISDEHVVYADFNDTRLSKLQMALLTSYERFDHIVPRFAANEYCNIEKAGTVGICIPFLEKASARVIAQTEKLIAFLDSGNIAYVLFSELTFTESWNQLDTIFVERTTIDKSLDRKCEGFIAALGEIVVYGEGDESKKEYIAVEDWVKREKVSG